jgi:hypothetical protein
MAVNGEEMKESGGEETEDQHIQVTLEHSQESEEHNQQCH